MIDAITYVMSLAFVGGVSASALIGGAWVGAMLTGTGSKISKSRRLPDDDDARVIAVNFLIGGTIGLMAGLAVGPGNWFMTIPVGMAGFFVGLFNALRITRSLNDAYLGRAERLMIEGDFKNAIEDASEVARSSEVLRGRANAIIESAREQRLNAPLPERFVSATTSNGVHPLEDESDVAVGLTTASLLQR